MKNPFIFILILLCVLLLGCNTYKKQARNYHIFSYEHPDELAKDCAKIFPVKDSVGKTVTDSTHRAVNVNYTGTIDSLQNKLDSISARVAADAADKANPCAEVAAKYQGDINTLKRQIVQFKAAYKPCKPDTVYRTQTIYKRDVATERVLYNQLAIKTDSLNLVNSKLKEVKEVADKRLLIIIALIVFLGVGIFAKVRNWI